MTQDIEVMKKQAGTAVEVATRLEVKDDATYEEATGVLGKIKTAIKLVKEKRDEVLEPAKAVVKAETARWAPVIAEAEEAERIVKSKMLAFVNERQRLQQIEEAKIQAKVEAGRLKPETAVARMAQVAEAPKQVTTDTGAKSQVRKHKVVNVVDANLVPDMYWTLDNVAIRRDALAGLVIPGVEVREENIIAG